MESNPLSQLLVSVSTIVVGQPNWVVLAAIMAVLGIVATLWWNRRLHAALKLAMCFRTAGWLILTACLINPLWVGTRPKQGANLLAVVTDVSRSSQVAVSPAGTTRADEIRSLLEAGEQSEPLGWLKQAGQNFELRRYVVSEHLQQVDRFGKPSFEGTASRLNSALLQLSERFEDQPLAGIILLTDGNATDSDSETQRKLLSKLSSLAPVFPVLLSEEVNRPDVSLRTVSISQTAFDDAPITILAQPHTIHAQNLQVRLTLADVSGTSIETLVRPATNPAPVRFQHRPAAEGTIFYQLKASLLNSDGQEVTDEITMVNNERLVSVDRGSQPRRILYVSGRPNWEFKFLRRAAQTDPLLKLTGLIRMARRESRFDFRGHEGERTNSLFRGFDSEAKEVAEEYDEPVLIRIGTRDAEELRSGFPEAADALFAFDAVILDDIEAGFFLADQQTLLHDFVSRRGGGLLMMGGQESFRQGEYDRTPIGEMLPLDLAQTASFPEDAVRLSLTRDGWLQPWVRLRSDETTENQRIESMPGFLTLSSVAAARPGAVVLAEVRDTADQRWPAIVAQRFGRGRTAALCIGDLWRWRMNEGLRSLQTEGEVGSESHESRNEPPLPGSLSPDEIAGPVRTASAEPAIPAITEDLSDHARACRQMLRWLVADVPQRLQLQVQPAAGDGTTGTQIRALVKGPDFHPIDHADVQFTVTDPDGTVIDVRGDPTDSEVGSFDAVIAGSKPGAWNVRAVVHLADAQGKQETLAATTGWANQPDRVEMQSVSINRPFLEQLAKDSGGRMIPLNEVDSFVAQLPQTQAPLMEVWSRPVWHQWWVFLIAVTCLLTDWTLRRRQGLP
jgi:uncharacterized membrane protein